MADALDFAAHWRDMFGEELREQTFVENITAAPEDLPSPRTSRSDFEEQVQEHVAIVAPGSENITASIFAGVGSAILNRLLLKLQRQKRDPAPWDWIDVAVMLSLYQKRSQSTLQPPEQREVSLLDNVLRVVGLPKLGPTGKVDSCMAKIKTEYVQTILQYEAASSLSDSDDNITAKRFRAQLRKSVANSARPLMPKENESPVQTRPANVSSTPALSRRADPRFEALAGGLYRVSAAYVAPLPDTWFPPTRADEDVRKAGLAYTCPFKCVTSVSTPAVYFRQQNIWDHLVMEHDVSALQLNFHYVSVQSGQFGIVVDNVPVTWPLATRPTRDTLPRYCLPEPKQ